METIKHDHWHILGAGAIGTLVAYKLSQQQFTFSFVGRNYFNSTNNKLDARFFTDLECVTHRLLGSECEAIQNLIICTKSTQALDAFVSVQARLNPKSIVVCLFNGLGAQQAIRKTANCPVFFATTTEGVSKIAPASYAYKGEGESYIDRNISRHINGEDFPKFFTIVDNIDQRLINKLAVNSLINPLTAIFDCQNGLLLSNAQAMATMQLLADEIACWLSTYWRHTSADDLLGSAKQVMQATANNSSSMRQDIQAKQFTEIDFINGYWVNNNPKQINLECNMRIIAKIKKIESKFL